MKHLKYVLPVFISIALLSSCATGTNEEKEEVVSEETTETISEPVEETEGISSEDMEVGTTGEETKKKSTSNKKNSHKPKEEKIETSETINRNIGVKLENEKEFDLMGYAAEEVAILKKEECLGKNCGHKIQLQSYNSEKSIVTVVMIKWKEESGKKSELREYKLNPDSKIDIGCSHSCDADNVKYTWKIVSAKYG